MRSLHGRLLLVASLVLASFLGLGALALDQAFRESAEKALRDRLQEQVYALLGAADEDGTGRMRLPDNLPNPSFSTPDSGLYAQAAGESGDYNWRSFSLVGRRMTFLQPQAPGQWRFSNQQWQAEAYRVLSFGVSWEDYQGTELVYTLAVAQDTHVMEQQVEAFRARLLYWLGGVSLLLLIAQGLVLGWGLKPLRWVAADLRRVESGEVDKIEGRYPTELKGLVRNLNALIQNGRASRDRYRNSLGDLAHSLKTPLTLLQGVRESGDCERLQEVVAEQVPRMNEIIQYQLRRAAAAGCSAPGTLVSVLPVVRRLKATLDKVYRAKEIDCRIEIDQATRFHGDEADLMELLGNLLENAYKYARGRVRVSARIDPQNAGRLLQLKLEDDGPGIPAGKRDRVLNRGVRVDQQLPGQGIGLSVANEIVCLYGGALEIGESNLGGTLVRVRFQQR